jgi:rhomboid protease GluP
LPEETIILEARRPGDADRARDALERAGIPYRTALLIAEPPRVVFSVDASREAEAHAALDGRFPRRAFLILSTVVALHLALVLWVRFWFDSAGYEILRHGALLKGATALQPWRLVTSMVLHADVMHALANGASMMVFGLPILARLGTARTALIYFAAGVGGALTALALAEAGTRIIGSSGAVAGLFGAWIVLTLARAKLADLPGRARLRTVGVAMLFLPALLSPVSSSGHPVSIGSHLGGLATGIAVGALLSRNMLGSRFGSWEARGSGSA